MNLVAELDALKLAVDAEQSLRGILQALMQGPSDPASATTVHADMQQMVIDRARALVEKADS